MASRGGGVESLCKGSAVRQLPDEHMTGKQTKVTTAIGAIIKHPNGKVWHKFKKAFVWECAVYHHHIRRQLIDYANAQGQFIHAAASRPNNDLDVTSFHPEQQAWGPTRENYPPILFEYAPPDKIKRAGELRYMYFHRHIVVDSNNRPVRAWPELNLTLSSKVEGFRLEALQRLNPQISSRDLLARMLPKITIERSRKPDTVRSQLKANALSMRKREFRGRNGMLSWKIREGSKEIREYMDSLLGPELVAKNNTRDMRPLTEDEIENIMYLIGKGRHPERSRNKPDNKPKNKPNNKAKRGRKTVAEAEKVGMAVSNLLPQENAEEGSDSEVPTDIEDHFEPMGLDGEQDDEELDANVPHGVVNHFEPLHSDEMEDEGNTFFTEQSPSEPDFDDPLDCRNHHPSDMVEAQIIALGIGHCIDQYKAWLNTDLVIDSVNFHWESYNTQWCALQEALERGWVDQGGVLDECPMLMRLPRWGGDIRSWSSA